ncbi:ATP-binding protein [Polymorphospora sp. NPDC051019]|uniref:sensor histidine kinase n=1 Tax=Polymorphospora sp. NPDC051019 TaxID=3155725 RepID=UPI0034283779
MVKQSDAITHVDGTAIAVHVVREFLRRLPAGDISGPIAGGAARVVHEVLRELGTPAGVDGAAAPAGTTGGGTVPPAAGPTRNSARTGDAPPDETDYPGHPVDYLRAGTLLFEVALPILAARWAGGDQKLLVRASTTLHRAVTEWAALASTAHDSLLTARLRTSRQEERRRIACELHDRVGHGMALALQNLDLHRRYLATDADRAAARLTRAITTIGETTRTIQQLSSELRRSVSDRGIEHALRTYLDHHVPPPVRVDLTVSDRVDTLPPEVAEELYLILCEAIRNAVRHAHPATLRIQLGINGNRVDASVADDGSGFDQKAAIATSYGGLLSMRDRAELLRGRLRLSSMTGHGTTVAVTVPMPGARP